MKILHVIIGLPASGAELFLQRLSMQQHSNDNEVTVISLTDDGKLGPILRSAGITVYSLGLTGLLSFFRVISQLRKLIVKLQPDILQSWMYHADFITAFASIGLPSKLVWSVRCSNPPIGNRYTFLLMKICSILSNFSPDKICYVADAAKINHQNNGYCIRKGVTIPNGYNFADWIFSGEKRETYREKFNVNSDTIIIGTVGRFHQDKGQDLLLEALSNIVHKMPDFRLLLIGRDCTENNVKLVSLIESFNLRNNVILFGESSDVSGLLSAIDIYIMSSRTEGFPNSLAEAMAVGLPCIATNVGDAEILAGRCVVLCMADAQSLAVSIVDFINLPIHQRVLLGQQASKHVHNSFSIVEIEKIYSDLYRSILRSE